MFEEFSTAAMATVLEAAQYARNRNRTEVGSTELLCAALRYDAVSAAFRRLGVDPVSVTGKGGTAKRRTRRTRGPMPYTSGAKAALLRSVELRRDLDRPLVTLGILVLALSEDESTTGTTLREHFRAASSRSVLADLADPAETGSSVAAYQVRLSG